MFTDRQKKQFGERWIRICTPADPYKVANETVRTKAQRGVRDLRKKIKG